MKQSLTSSILALALLLLCPGWSTAQADNLTLSEVAPQLYCLQGSGGNIAVLEGPTQLLLVDTGVAESAEAVAALLEERFAKPVAYIVNTHYHFDHMGGNEVLGKQATIITNETCQSSHAHNLETEGKPTDTGAATKTYTDELELSLEGSETTVLLRHLGPGHTAGDTIVVFPTAKVLHTGDLLFHGIVPYIDVADGANTAVWAQTLRTLAEQYKGYTVIPGHGSVTDTSALLKLASYLQELHDKVEQAIKDGVTRDEVVAAVDLSDWTGLQSYGDMLTLEKNVLWVYDELLRQQER